MIPPVISNPPAWLAIIISAVLGGIGVALFFALVHLKNLIF
jgi:hypothetical protein